MRLSAILKRLACRHEWQVVATADVPAEFAMMFGNAIVTCQRCGKSDARYTA